MILAQSAYCYSNAFNPDGLLDVLNIRQTFFYALNCNIDAAIIQATIEYKKAILFRIPAGLPADLVKDCTLLLTLRGFFCYGPEDGYITIDWNEPIICDNKDERMKQLEPYFSINKL